MNNNTLSTALTSTNWLLSYSPFQGPIHYMSQLEYAHGKVLCCAASQQGRGAHFYGMSNRVQLRYTRIPKPKGIQDMWPDFSQSPHTERNELGGLHVDQDSSAVSAHSPLSQP